MNRVIKIPDGTACEEHKNESDIVIANTYYFYHCRRDNISVVCTNVELLDRVRNRKEVPKLCPGCRKAMKLGKVRIDIVDGEIVS